MRLRNESVGNTSNVKRERAAKQLVRGWRVGARQQRLSEMRTFRFRNRWKIDVHFCHETKELVKKLRGFGS